MPQWRGRDPARSQGPSTQPACLIPPLHIPSLTLAPGPPRPGPSASQRGGQEPNTWPPFHPAAPCLLVRGAHAQPGQPRDLLGRPELLAVAGWPEAQAMSWHPAGPSHMVSPLPRSGLPGEPNASYAEQNKARRRQNQALRRDNTGKWAVLVIPSAAGCWGLRRPPRTAPHPLLPGSVCPKGLLQRVGCRGREHAAWASAVLLTPRRLSSPAWTTVSPTQLTWQS